MTKVLFSFESESDAREVEEYANDHKGRLTCQSAEILGTAVAQASEVKLVSGALLVSRVALVYQGGIANVFQVDEYDLTDVKKRNARALLCGPFNAAMLFAKGMGAAGAEVRTFGCNMAGQITNQPWAHDIGPFRNEATILNIKDGVYLSDPEQRG